MSTLVNRVLTHADKVNYWLGPKEQEKLDCSPRYSMSAPPPPYEKIVPTEKKKYSFSNMIWKRASFSSAYSVPEVLPVTTIDKAQVEQGITLLNIASDMKDSSNPSMAFDLYMMGLEKILSALPLDSDPSAKLALERKLKEIKELHQLDLNLPPKVKEKEDKPIRRQLSDLVINVAVLGAVALKKSPIPDAVSSVVNYAVDSIQIIDEKHQIRKRTWDLAALGISKAVQIDRQFEIHQLLTEAVYTGFSAFVKAGLAYAEAPGYHQ